jgi:hypothetical protein
MRWDEVSSSKLVTVSLRTLAGTFKSTATLPSDGENKKYSPKLEIKRCCEDSRLLEFNAVRVGNNVIICRIEKPKKTV